MKTLPLFFIACFDIHVFSAMHTINDFLNKQLRLAQISGAIMKFNFYIMKKSDISEIVFKPIQ